MCHPGFVDDELKASRSAHEFARARTRFPGGRHIPGNFAQPPRHVVVTSRAARSGSLHPARPRHAGSEEDFMTPQERKLVDDLFERLATLERNPREPDAEDAIDAGLRQAPNATYALVQTVLLQDEALRQANERIRELRGRRRAAAGAAAAFSIRCATRCSAAAAPARLGPAGRRRPCRWACRPASAMPAIRIRRRAASAPYQQAPEPARGGAGGSFLGTAAAAAAGVIGGSLLMNSLGGMFGGGQAKAQGLGDVAGKERRAPRPTPGATRCRLGRWQSRTTGRARQHRKAGWRQRARRAATTRRMHPADERRDDAGGRWRLRHGSRLPISLIHAHAQISKRSALASGPFL